MRTFFQGVGLPQRPGGRVDSPAAPTAAVLARRREVGPVVVHMVRLARQAGYADASGPAASGISDTALRAALSVALRSSEPGYPSFYDDGILDIFFDSSTVIYATYPTGTALFWWQSYTIAADRKNVKLNGDRQEIATGWIPAGPVATPPAPIAPTASASAATRATPTATTPNAWQTAQEVAAFSRGATVMPHTPPRIFDNALHAMGKPGIGETPAAYAASAATRRPGRDAMHACLSHAVLVNFTVDDLIELEQVAPDLLRPLAEAGRNNSSRAQSFAALGYSAPQPRADDCSIYAITAAKGALDRARKARQGTASGSGHPSPCGCGGHPTPTATGQASAASAGTPKRYSPPKIFDIALAEMGLPPIGGRK